MAPFVMNLWPSAPAGVAYVRFPATTANYAYSPHDAAREPGAGDFELRLLARVPSWTPTARRYLVCDRGTDIGWALNLETGGTLRFAAFVGSMEYRSSSVAVSTVFTDNEWGHIKVTRVGTTLTFYTSLDGSTWTQLGSTATLSGTVVAATASGLTVNAWEETGVFATGGGLVDYSRVRFWTGGIEGVGTLQNDFDASLMTAGTPATYTAVTGEVYTFSGTEYEVFS